MPLPKEVYQALENIVGLGNISEDPAVLDSYAFQFMAEILQPEQSKFMPRAEAVVLPGSTQEVQAIVRTCNRYRIKYKAYSTGWGAHAVPQNEGVIQLDMRRMDRILEINEKNMFAVVEPYVIGGTLQAEAMKMGLNCNMIGAGASHSPLAGSINAAGGPANISMSAPTEALLALEWVMPTGDILRTGSLGSGDGWFCGEGPGPSLRGLVRGKRGAAGGMGVFTKCAIKLSAWPGPAELPVDGTIPAYNSPLPDNFRVYTLAFPSWQAFADAYYKVYDGEIGYIAHRQFSMLGGDLAPAFWILYSDPTKTLEDLEAYAKRPEIQKLTEEMRYSFQIVLAGMTPRDIEYQEKVLSQILAETGGWKVAAMAEPDMQRFTLLYLIRLPSKNLNFVYTGAYIESFCQSGTPDFVISYAPVAMEVLRKIQRKGLLVDCGDDSMMGCIASMGGGGCCSLEQFCFYDPHDKESVKAALAFIEDSARAAREHGFPPGIETPLLMARMTREQRQSRYASAPQPSIFRWQQKIKQTLDPSDTGDEGYETLGEPPK